MPDNVNRPGMTVEDEFSHYSSPGFLNISRDILSELIKRGVGLLPSDEDLGVNTTDIITGGGLPAGQVPLYDTQQRGLNFTQPVPISTRPEQKPENIIYVPDVAVTPALEQPIYDPSAQAQSDLDAANAAARQTAPVNNPNSWNYGFGPPFGLTEAHGINDPYNNFAINALEAGDTVNKRMRNREQPTLMGGGVDLSSLFQKGKDIFFSDPMQNFFQLSRDALAQPVNPGDWGLEPFARAQVARNQLEYEREQTRLDREIEEADLAARRAATAYDRRIAEENLRINKAKLALLQNPLPDQPKINKVTIAAMADAVALLEKNGVIKIGDFYSYWKPNTPDPDEAREAIALAALEIQKNSPETSPTDAIIQAIANLKGQGEAPANGANAPVQNGSISGATSGDLNISGKTPAVIN